MPEAPAPGCALSRTRTSAPEPAPRVRSSCPRCHAVESPWIPAPTMTYGALRGTSIEPEDRRMDTYLAIVSKRDWRRFAARPVPPDAERRILEAGRLASSAANRQRRRFVVIEDADVRERLAQTV